MIPSLVTSLVLGVVTATPSTVPARGKSESILRLDSAAMVHVEVPNASGVQCTLVDHHRGPFRSEGAVDGGKCAFDELLDAGQYKLRVESSEKVKADAPPVPVQVKAFVETTVPLVRLDEGRSVTRPLHPGEQATFWVRVPQRRAVSLRAFGRTAGLVKLWRDGAWLEDLRPQHTTPMPRDGQTIHEWRLLPTLEAGDYEFVVYGTEAREWTKGQPQDTLFVSFGAPPAPEERGLELTLPAWGFAEFDLPEGAWGVVANVDPPVGAPVVVRLEPKEFAPPGSGSGSASSCTVPPKALRGVCSTQHAGKAMRLQVNGPPDAHVSLLWAPHKDELTDGTYDGRVSGASTSFKLFQTGDYAIGTHETPWSTDDAPLSCQIARIDQVANTHVRTIVGKDLLQLDPDRGVEQSFNYSGRYQEIWFETTSSARWHFLLAGERRSTCAILPMDGSKSFASTPEHEETCDLDVRLSAGAYRLVIRGGIEGIEKAKFTTSGSSNPRTGKTSCFMPKVPIVAGQKYELYQSRGTAPGALRGFIAKALPLTLDVPLALNLDAGETVSLPVKAGSAIRVRSIGNGAFACATSKGAKQGGFGTCELDAVTKDDELVITNRSSAPESILATRPRPVAPLAPLQAHEPAPAPIPSLAVGEPAFRTFAAGEAHSFVFDVKEPGLYHLTTEGLLQTTCVLRTPVVTELARDSGSGRGRNCLVAQYLPAGRYRATASTVAPSEGRAAVVLRRRPAVLRGTLEADAEAFFRVEAGELAQQKIVVKKSDAHLLATRIQGASTSCRLDDADGWPVEPLPASCDDTRRLEKGTYLWTQLPLTVESMRRTVVELVKPAVVLSGAKLHVISLNRPYDVELADRGRDEFQFDVPARLDVGFSLTNGMQGRVFRVEGDRRVPVDVIAPQAAEEHSSEESYDGEEGSEQTERSFGFGGTRLGLAAGRYVLVAVHSREDKGIHYGVRLQVDVLVPGVESDVTVPSRVPLVMPASGIFRLRTQGDLDVRCRIFDGARLVYESAGDGDDWNCALAEPLPAGRYDVVFESESLLSGATHVTTSLPEVKAGGPLPTNAAVKLIPARLMTFDLAGSAKDEVLRVEASADAPIACAVTNQAGEVLHRQSNAASCAFAYRPLLEPAQLRLWTLSRPAAVNVFSQLRAIGPKATELEAGTAMRAEIAADGLYRTSEGIACLPDERRGVLLPCGPDVALAKGSHVFTLVGSKAAPVSLEPIVHDDTTALTAALVLGRRPLIQVSRTTLPSVHLLAVKAPLGEPAEPVCQFNGGASALGPASCWAASTVGPEATARLEASSLEPVRTDVTRLSVPWPATATALVPGRRTLTWSGPAARWTLPAEASRVDLVLAPEAWAVRYGPDGSAQDVCPPAPALSHCTLGARGGELFTWSPGEARAEVELVVTPKAPARVALDTSWELNAEVPGTAELNARSVSIPRMVEVTGALGCTALLGDARRVSGCRFTLPAGLTARITIQHDSGPIRVVAAPESELLAARAGVLPATQVQELEAAKAVVLSGTSVARLIAPGNETIVHLKATSGVCVVVENDRVIAVEGTGSGCALSRLVGPGRTKFVVRGFAGAPLFGEASWTGEDVAPLEDGVGAEAWIAPGETRFFRFRTASVGRIGIGVQVGADTLECRSFDAAQKPIGEGCQQFLSLDAGAYLLSLTNPPGGSPARFRPVVLGLAGSRMDVPDDYLRSFFERLGVMQ